MENEKLKKVTTGLFPLKVILFLIFNSSFLVLSAQQHIVDSLLLVVKSGADDTTKVNNLVTLSLDYRRLNKMKEALMYGLKADTLAVKLNYKKGISAACNKIGAIYYLQGDYTHALDNYFNALKIDVADKDSMNMAKNYGNVGNIYAGEKDFKNALAYDTLTLNIARKVHYAQLEANTLGNIGILFEEQGRYNEALNYYNQSLKMNVKLGDKNSMAINKVNIGAVYSSLKQYDTALSYYKDVILVFNEVGNLKGVISTMGNMGDIYSKQKKYKEAEKCLTRSATMADSMHFLYELRGIEQILSEMYAATGDWHKAFASYQRYSDIKDSLINEDKSKEIGKLEARADYDKELALQKADAEKQTALDAAESKKQRLTLFLVGAIAIAIAIIAAIILRSLRITRNQKDLIEKQKADVEEQKLLIERQKAIVDEKNKDITDSIHYASRIQHALLTSEDYIGKHLHHFFILFKPRDIVSGDFYWAIESPSSFLICAGDCTGHGVPGAFMSLLNISMLNEATLEKKIYSPDKILNELREHIIKALNPGGHDKGSKDGMDCVLCSFDFTKMKANFACANNPLWPSDVPLQVFVFQ